MDIQKLKFEVSKIIDQFGKEEIGNRLSQFAMASLKGFIIQEFDKEEKEVSPNSGA